ncbi:MAG: redoxin domain-containing protein [Alphaproteobacteria bacterium]|nr:redoxin domain-containing protein [Alphaproteobacteria bacterium]MBU1515153.1 redoxin domain-containing protein [Alphaproteobacteria bacterium]MBU2092283.1 redoxin domain-containing protein [Alphaproteobacteria bacterium]MBU2152877.1 redoxin domain-containing protein [Alphaproteobacteria bacterium]MBU2305708.1 redoxin domain-containing protein [Alphaproteobacteria bacterium]
MPAPAISSCPPLSRRAAALGLLAAPLAAAPVLGGALAACSAPADGAYRALPGDGAWLNGPPLRPADLLGKVVLVNFWTYTCINSLRPLPYVRSWADKYRDRGLAVLGVHTPEFSFEQELPRVRTAVEQLGVRYPVALDNDFAIWRSFRNTAWPGFYILDTEGRVRHQRLGEGDYDTSERVIQTLLADGFGGRVSDPIVPVMGVGPEAAPDWDDLGSPETYAGYAKAENFAGVLRRDTARSYETPARLPLNSWALAGTWTARPEFAELTRGAGSIAYRFHARDLHLVMGPGASENPVRFRVRLDGADPGLDHGSDTDGAGWGEVREARMYQLIRQAGPVRDRTCVIEFQAAGPRAYCFTFG